MAVKDESLRYSLDHFTEVQEITTLIESIGSICHDDILLEAAEERFIGKLAEFVFFLFSCLAVKFCQNAAPPIDSHCSMNFMLQYN